MAKKLRSLWLAGHYRRESAILRHWYKKFNRQYFYGKLPNNTFCFWDKYIDNDAYGQFYDCNDINSNIHDFPAIAIAPYLQSHEIFASTLLHEMIHVSKGYGHDEPFERERRRLLRYRKVRRIVM